MKQLFLVFSVIALTLTSCYSYDPGPSRFLDENKHNEMFEKWKDLKIKNYSFTYSFIYWLGPPRFEVVGNVTVKDGVGKVIFKDNKWESKIETFNLKRSYYHITNMEEVFQHILDKNEENRNNMDKQIWQHVWYSTMDYDAKYFFPRHIYYGLQEYGYRPIPHSVGSSGGPHERFDITDFKVLE